jgi:putative ABC transport system ATP-binding protein
MLELKNITKSYYSKSVFKNANLKINTGEFVAIVGKSGSGKTTLLNIMALIDIPDSGSVYYNNSLLNKNNRLDFYKNDLGYLFQNYGLIDDKTIYQNMSYYISKEKFKHLTKNKINSHLKKFGINADCDDYIYTLSGGEQQRVALLRVFLKKPSILLCDEPTGNLDLENRDIIFDFLRKLNKSGVTIVIVTHDESLRKYVDRIIEVS